MIEGLGYGRRKLIKKIIEANWNVDKAEYKKFNYNELLFVIQEMHTEEGKEYFSRRGSKGHSVFREFVKLLLYRNIANYDSMLLLTSDKGTGKSSAAIMIARYWCKLLGIKFSPKRHIAYNNADVMKKIDLLKKFEPIIADEAIRFACITGSSLVKTQNGLIKIKDLLNKKNFKVYSFNEKTKKEELQIAEKCIKVKKDMVFEIESDNGSKIQATKEHKFLTKNGWKKLEELNVGDDLIDI